MLMNNEIHMFRKKYMKIFFIFIMCCFISACSSEYANKKTENTDKNYLTYESSDKVDYGNAIDKKEENIEVDTRNRSIIAETLGIEENNRKIRFILSTLNTIRSGQIKSAKLTEIDGEKILYVIAEDDVEYEIYLSRSGSVEAVKNIVTGEWIIRSQR